MSSFSKKSALLSLMWSILLGILALAVPFSLGEETITHRVVTGDTLYNISKRYGVSIDQIKQLNNLSDNIIGLNQVLKIKDTDIPPAPSESSGTGTSLIPEIRLAADLEAPLFTATVDAEGRWIRANRIPAGTIRCEDSSGNRYLAGTFSGSKEFDSITLRSRVEQDQQGGKDLSDSWLACLSNAGEWLWARNLAVLTASDADQLALSVDGSGFAYVAGTFSGELALDTVTLRSEGGTDVFVAKLNQSGNLLWAINTSGKGNERLLKLEVAENGGTIVCGSAEGTLQFGSDNIGDADGSGGNLFFLARLDPGGNWDWGRRIRQISPDCWGRCHATDATGNTWIAENFYGDPVPNPVYAGAMSVNSSLRMLDSQGREIWSRKIDGKDVSIDWISFGAGLFVAGTFLGDLTLGDQQLRSGDLKDQYYARFDLEGNCLWARKWLGADLHIIEADPSGNLCLVAKYRPYIDSGGQPHYLRKGDGDLIVARLDGAGNWLWVAQTKSGGSPGKLQAGFDAQGNLQIQGSCAAEISFINLMP